MTKQQDPVVAKGKVEARRDGVNLMERPYRERTERAVGMAGCGRKERVCGR